MQKVLVTGGCGYIGSHTIIDLLESGFQVFSIDNYSNSSSKTLDQIEAVTGKRIKNYEVDLRNKQDLFDVLEKEGEIAGIIHFAALKAVGESVDKPLLYYDNNLNGILNILAAQKKYNIPYHIFSSSCSVYGNADELPVTENTPVKDAESPYARTKQMCENIIQDFTVPNKNFQFILLRYFNPAGAHESGLIGESPVNKAANLVPVITETAYGLRESMMVFGNDYDTRDGSCIRDFIHVMDLAHAHTLCLQYLLEKKSTKPWDVFNVGTGNGISVLEAINAFESSTGQKLNYSIGERRPGDVISVYANKNKAENLLGWTPSRSIKDIMKTAWDWENARRKEV
ncbi:UDP-glucose 4-epimerase GalE [Membranihabitans maritimus]|uniref:UDP-glucose 4-epimerase GalE n=1 Tax=Membranihabitans maritimus TaxID=2904244 RepID=UPI001F01F85D|nr:UDP-glucose 4-epimerase GalE [Membranihabitans maritimus]